MPSSRASRQSQHCPAPASHRGRRMRSALPSCMHEEVREDHAVAYQHLTGRIPSICCHSRPASAHYSSQYSEVLPTESVSQVSSRPNSQRRPGSHRSHRSGSRAHSSHYFGGHNIETNHVAEESSSSEDSVFADHRAHTYSPHIFRPGHASSRASVRPSADISAIWEHEQRENVRQYMDAGGRPIYVQTLPHQARTSLHNTQANYDSDHDSESESDFESEIEYIAISRKGRPKSQQRSNTKAGTNNAPKPPAALANATSQPEPQTSPVPNRQQNQNQDQIPTQKQTENQGLAESQNPHRRLCTVDDRAGTSLHRSQYGEMEWTRPSPKPKPKSKTQKSGSTRTSSAGSGNGSHSGSETLVEQGPQSQSGNGQGVGMGQSIDGGEVGKRKGNEKGELVVPGWLRYFTT